MNGQTGHSIRSVEPSDLEKARDLARNAIQWLARLANSYIPAEQQDRHLMLEWHAGRRSLVTRTFGDGLSLELRFPDLHLQFAGNGKLEPHVLDIEDHTPAEVEAWLLVELLHRDVDRSRFSKALPYTVPRLLTGDSTDYSPASCMPALAAITDWLEYGTEILRTLTPAGTSLYCWPETFQIGRLIAMDGAGAHDQTMLRAGMSPGDALCPEPFFFVLPESSGPRGQPHPGTVLPASRIASERISPEGVGEFLDAARASNRNRLRL